MKLLHTSDWHLGKKLFKEDRTEEHLYFLNWLIETINNERIDLLVICGDIFDVQNPPHESIKIFFKFLRDIVFQTKAKVAIISGNHDSGIFLESPTPLVDSERIFIKGTISPNPSDHVIELKINDNEIIKLAMLPYFRNYEIYRWVQHYDLQELPEEEQIITAISKWVNEIEGDSKQIFIAHHLFGEFLSGDSEHSLNLTGISSISLDILKQFNYIALGHIHKYQKISSSPPAYYTGSPIAFRFSERAQKKINIIELDQSVTIKEVDVPQLKDIKTIETTIDQIESDLIKLALETDRETYLEVKIVLKEPMVGISDKIREITKDTKLNFISFSPIFIDDKIDIENEIVDVNNISINDHFKNFYKIKFPEAEISDTLINEFNLLIEESQQEGNR